VGVLGWLLGGAPQLRFPIKVTSPSKTVALTPEFLSVLLGLTMYTAAFVAEVVRRYPVGATRPGRGRRRWACHRPGTMRLVTLPQALRVIIPPMTNQFLNLTKNSSLAVAIGYPDVVSIANTASTRPVARWSASPS
jgi:general L-amino acid transport system permease protein